MATIITHGIAAIVIGKAKIKDKMSGRFWFYLAILSMLPDIDVVGLPLGVDYGDFWGHRGFTHSLAFAFILGVSIATIFFRSAVIGSRKWWGWVMLYFVVIASHGVFDAMTNGGLGIAFFSPFDDTRYFFPWTPIDVSPIGIHGFTGERAYRIISSELIWIVTPLFVFYFLSSMAFKKKDLMKGE